MAANLIGRRAALGGGALLAVGPLLGTRRARAQQGAGPMRIGVLTDETGPYADSGGKGSVLAAQMAVADFGSTVLGRAIEIVHGYTQKKPDIAASLARQWYDSGVDAIVDLPVTSVASAVQQVAKEKRRTVMITAGAATEFTSKTCSPVSTHWADDTHALSAGAAAQIVKAGGKTWYFITVDYAFGTALERDAVQVITAKGGQVLGSIRYPIGNADYSSMLLQAHDSNSQVIGLASVGNDLVNLVKQAGEFGVSGRQTLVGFLIYITEVHALGLDAAQGFTFASGFYWDQNDVSRAWSKRFSWTQKAVPTRVQAAVYTASLHFLKGVQKAGTRDAVAVNKAMREIPVDYLGRPASIRADGRVLYDLTVYRVKRPGESRAPWDYYDAIANIPANEAFLPMNPVCAS
jgi:branched-chain amino acid transport system substrate-binding protein